MHNLPSFRDDFYLAIAGFPNWRSEDKAGPRKLSQHTPKIGRFTQFCVSEPLLIVSLSGTRPDQYFCSRGRLFGEPKLDGPFRYAAKPEKQKLKRGNIARMSRGQQATKDRAQREETKNHPFSEHNFRLREFNQLRGVVGKELETDTFARLPQNFLLAMSAPWHIALNFTHTMVGCPSVL